MAYQTVQITTQPYTWTQVSTDSETVVVQNEHSNIMEVYVGTTSPTGSSKGIVIPPSSGRDTMSITGLVTGEDVWVRTPDAGTAIVIRNVP